MTVAAVVLAAGAGSRFAGPDDKLSTPLRGRPLLEWAVGAARDAGLDETVLVVAGGSVAERLGERTTGVTILVNQRPEEGLASSLAVALDHAADVGHEAVVVGLGDQPFLASTAWRALAAVDAPLAVATYGGRRGHPVRLGNDVWDDVPRVGEVGARRLLDLRPDQVRELPCDGDPADVDTLEDLERWS